jgi:hypothetical protein
VTRAGARPNAGRAARRQRGATLFVVVVILIAVAWFAMTGFRISGQHLQLVGNDQAQRHVAAAAQRAIEQTISSNAFTKDPAAVAAAPIHTDVDGDGTDDFTATLAPAPKCYRVRAIKTSELDVALAGDRQCLISSGGNGVLIERPGAAPPSGDSLCANSEWNVAAAVAEPGSGATVTVHQGVGIRVAKTDAKNFCK